MKNRKEHHRLQEAIEATLKHWLPNTLNHSLIAHAVATTVQQEKK